jgi:hypothetical protein
MIRKRLSALASLSLIVSIAVLGIGWTVSANTTKHEQYAHYTNTRWHFSIIGPADMKYAEYDGPGQDSQTIQFSDATADKIFEVTAEPYTQMDVALGEEGTPNPTSDQSTTLGVINVYHADTLAFSFHRKGIAYTVTTLPGNENWLLPILQSWEFTE